MFNHVTIIIMLCSDGAVKAVLKGVRRSSVVDAVDGQASFTIVFGLMKRN